MPRSMAPFSPSPRRTGMPSMPGLTRWQTSSRSIERVFAKNYSHWCRWRRHWHRNTMWSSPIRPIWAVPAWAQNWQSMSKRITRTARATCLQCLLRFAPAWRKQMRISPWLPSTHGCSCPVLKSCGRRWCWLKPSAWHILAHEHLKKSVVRWCRLPLLCAVQTILMAIKVPTVAWLNLPLSRAKRICSLLEKIAIPQIRITLQKFREARWHTGLGRMFFVSFQKSQFVIMQSLAMECQRGIMMYVLSYGLKLTEERFALMQVVWRNLIPPIVNLRRIKKVALLGFGMEIMIMWLRMTRNLAKLWKAFQDIVHRVQAFSSILL